MTVCYLCLCRNTGIEFEGICRFHTFASGNNGYSIGKAYFICFRLGLLSIMYLVSCPCCYLGTESAGRYL